MTVSEKIAVLSGRLTRARFARLSRALDFRTRKIILVLEDVFQPHNAAAVLRNCDAFGLQEVHIIENRYRAKISSNVDTGVSKWMDIIRHTSSLARPSKVGMGREKLLAEHLENTRAALVQDKDALVNLNNSTQAGSSLSEAIISERANQEVMEKTQDEGLSAIREEIDNYEEPLCVAY